jgi:hypothetical protein
VQTDEHVIRMVGNEGLHQSDVILEPTRVG